MGVINLDHSGAGDGVTITAVAGAFKVNGAAPAGLGPTGTVSGGGIIDVSSGSVFGLTPTDNVNVSFSNVPSGSAGTVVLAYTSANVTEKYVVDPSTVISEGGTFPSNAGNFRWANNGSLIVIASNFNGYVYASEVSTPYDPLTMSATFAYYNTGLTPAEDVWISDDGLTMIVSGNTTSTTRYRKYALGTAFDISTASYQNGGSLGYGSGSFDFSPDGNYIFTINSMRVAIHSLPSPFQVNGGSTYIAYRVIDTSSRVKCVRANATGTKVVCPYGNTFAYAEVFSFSSFGSKVDVPWDYYGQYVAWGDSGSVLTTLYSQNWRTYSAEGASSQATLAFSSAIKWAGGSAPTSPAVGATDVYSFSTPDSGTTWYGQVIGQTFA